MGSHCLRQLVLLLLQLAQFPLKGGRTFDILVKIADCQLYTSNFHFGVYLCLAGLREFFSFRSTFGVISKIFCTHLFEQALLPMVTHSCCPECEATLDRAIDNLGEPISFSIGHQAFETRSR